MKYHCYIDAYESVYSADVEAASPEMAASRAADEQGIQGRWTVIPGEPVYVDVVARRWHEAVLTEPSPG